MRTRAFVFAFLLGLASGAIASDVPFYLRQIAGPRDISAINENFRSVVNDITKIFAKWMDPAPATSKALCLSPATGAVSGCTSAVDASGNCTCP